MITNKAVSLSDQVYEKLESDIYSGKYKRGDIITEPALCEELGVSRTPVHEAVTRLKYDHIVEDCSKGILVIGISMEDAELIYDIRKSIECMAAAACAKNITEEQLEDLKETMEMQTYFMKKGNSEKVKYYDSQFHLKIYKYCGSAVYYDVLEPLHKKIQKYRQASVEDKSRAEFSVYEHQNILNQIAAHNEPAAAEAMYYHICRAEEHLKLLSGIE